MKTFSTPLDAMPSDAKQIVAFDGKALRAHPLFASMLKTLRASPAGNDLGKLEKACGFNPIDVIDSAAAAGDFDHMNIVVAFRGTKSPQEILGCMAKVDGKEPTTLRGLAAVPLGGPGVAVAAGDVVLIGDRPAVEAALNGGSGAGGGGDFGGAASLASGGRIGGTGRADGGGGSDAAEGAFSIAEIDQRPRPIHQVGGVYPSEMRQRNVEGSVTVIFIVDESGRVVNPRVEKSSHPEFEAPALDAVRQWRFEPAMRGGKRVSCRMRVPMRFQPK